jgi:hypothetical protein
MGSAIGKSPIGAHGVAAISTEGDRLAVRAGYTFVSCLASPDTAHAAGLSARRSHGGFDDAPITVLPTVLLMNLVAQKHATMLR